MVAGLSLKDTAALERRRYFKEQGLVSESDSPVRSTQGGTTNLSNFYTLKKG